MVIIRIKADLAPEDHAATAEKIRAQAATGLVILPPMCEVYVDATGEEIQAAQQKDGDRVKELEEELARAMFYLSAQRDCDTCKHNNTSLTACRTAKTCPGDCKKCLEQLRDCCPCYKCAEGSQWEWMGAHGNG